LIIDGQNLHHDWKATTPVMKEILERTGRFQVSVLTSPPGGASAGEWKQFRPDFGKHDVLLNYWGEDWPKGTFAAMESFVANGGGVVVVHSSVAGFGVHPEFAHMTGVGWRTAIDTGRCVLLDDEGKTSFLEAGEGGASGHSKRHAFDIDLRQREDPIVQGLPNPWKHATDELYHRLRGPAEDMTILGTAYSPMTEGHEPMIWTLPYGKGRSFVTVLGHDPTAMSSEGFHNTLARGAEWAATGKVMVVVPGAETKPTHGTTPGQYTASRATIEKHLDPKIQVYGQYAAVKLPITKGVALWNPTVIETAPDGTIYAANYTGEVYTLQDSDGDGLEDTAQLFCNVKDNGLRYPTGLAIKDGEVYVGTTQEIRAYKDTDGDGKADESRTFFKNFPWTLHAYDWTFGLNFGPDGHLYFILCTDYLNGQAAPDPKGYRGSILRVSPDGRKVERYAYGLRFAYGLAFNHLGDLFFSDNKGGGNPTEEFNRVVRDGFYGHNEAKYPDHGPKIDPLVEIQHGFGSGGLCANSLNNDFGGAGGDVFFACWGPDGRWERGSIVRIKLNKRSDGSYRAVEIPVARSIAKVIDLAFGPDGTMYAARFGRENRNHTPYGAPEGDIYRFFNVPWMVPNAPEAGPLAQRVVGDVKRGEVLDNQMACASCHSLDGTTELLGPNLKGIGDMFSRSEMLTAISQPSAGIKSGHETKLLTRKNGEVVMGRMVSTSDKEAVMMVPGNQTIAIPQNEIKTIETLEQSLMPPGLIPKSYYWIEKEGEIGLGQGDGAIDDLLAYLNVREDPEVEHQEDKDPMVWQFHYGAPLIKPYFHPLGHPGVGVALTDFRPADHVWHRGLWFCWKTINGVNYWEEDGKTQQSAGLTEVRAAKAIPSPDFSCEMDLMLSYHPPKESPVVTERRTIRVSAPDAKGNYRIDWDMNFTAEQDATFDVTPPSKRGGPKWGGYGGLSFRGDANWATVLYADSEAGLLSDPSKVRHGEKARWFSVARDREGVVDGVTIFDHPGNPNHPTAWYVYRDGFRFLNPSPLLNGPLTLKKGESMRLRYRVLVHEGRPDVKLLDADYKGGKWDE